MSQAQSQPVVPVSSKLRRSSQTDVKKAKGRDFFQQLEPTFSIAVPRNTVTKLEFLDHSDPAKSTVVRKKAREWVNKNREISKHVQSTHASARTKKKRLEVKEVNEREDTPDSKSETRTLSLSPPRIGSFFDSFNRLPQVGRKYEHIIQFFLTSCPEEIPCSDDKYSDSSKYAMVPFSTDNTVLGNMAKDDVSFILWLFATVTIRDGMWGGFDTSEVQWYYNKSLKSLQKKLKEEDEAGTYSVSLLNCLACITATASFSGMFKIAELHCDALLRVIRLRGNGDMLKGLEKVSPWTVKAMQWCEIMVATQLIEAPRIPYLAQTVSSHPPSIVLSEAAIRTSISLVALPQFSEPIRHVIHLLHHLGVSYAQTEKGVKVDSYVIQTLYDAEYTLLQLLSAQKEPDHGFSHVEVLLCEAFQLYFWTGPRMLPPQTRLCDLLMSRLMKALLPLVLEKPPKIDLENMPETVANVTEKARAMLAVIATHMPRTEPHPRDQNRAITWSLALGTMVSASLCRPEYTWFKENLCKQLKAMKLSKSEQDYQEFLKLFPTTDGFAWIDLRTLHVQVAAEEV